MRRCCRCDCSTAPDDWSGVVVAHFRRASTIATEDGRHALVRHADDPCDLPARGALVAELLGDERAEGRQRVDGEACAAPQEVEDAWLVVALEDRAPRESPIALLSQRPGVASDVALDICRIICRLRDVFERRSHVLACVALRPTHAPPLPRHPSLPMPPSAWRGEDDGARRVAVPAASVEKVAPARLVEGRASGFADSGDA